MPTEAVVRTSALDRPELLAKPVEAALHALPALAPLVEVAAIDPALADTEAFSPPTACCRRSPRTA